MPEQPPEPDSRAGQTRVHPLINSLQGVSRQENGPLGISAVAVNHAPHLVEVIGKAGFYICGLVINVDIPHLVTETTKWRNRQRPK